MNEQIRNCLIALLSLGLAASYSISASAQIIAADPPAVVVEDDDETAVFVDDDDPAVLVEDDYVEAPAVVLADRDGMDRCAATFRSFDPRSGTYVTYGGETRRCPYLE